MVIGMGPVGGYRQTISVISAEKAARQKRTADLLKQIGFFGHFVILVKTLVRKVPGKIKVPQNSKKP